MEGAQGTMTGLSMMFMRHRANRGPRSPSRTDPCYFTEHLFSVPSRPDTRSYQPSIFVAKHLQKDWGLIFKPGAQVPTRYAPHYQNKTVLLLYVAAVEELIVGKRVWSCGVDHVMEQSIEPPTTTAFKLWMRYPSWTIFLQEVHLFQVLEVPVPLRLLDIREGNPNTRTYYRQPRETFSIIQQRESFAMISRRMKPEKAEIHPSGKAWLGA
jgi:hypothetical protein